MTEHAFGPPLDPEVLHADAVRFAEGCLLQSPSLRAMIQAADRILTGWGGPGRETEALAWLFERDDHAWALPAPLEALYGGSLYGTMGRWRLVPPTATDGPTVYGTAVVNEFSLTY